MLARHPCSEFFVQRFESFRFRFVEIPEDPGRGPQIAYTQPGELTVVRINESLLVDSLSFGVFPLIETASSKTLEFGLHRSISAA